MKKKYIIYMILCAVSVLLVVAASIIYEKLNIWIPFAVSIALMLISIVWLAVFYVKNVKYRCPDCGDVFYARALEILFAPHIATRRRVKCPSCNRYKWCKEVWE
jgi:DNA-directed RNA polymerase subunit RPC12/RpoP